MTQALGKAVDEKFCPECCAVIKAKAEICPKCGVRIGTLAPSNLGPTAVLASEKKGIEVSFLLGVGIFLMPFVFAWFLLRDGYSKKSRVISFVWMAISVLTLIRAP